MEEAAWPLAAAPGTASVAHWHWHHRGDSGASGLRVRVLNFKLNFKMPVSIFLAASGSYIATVNVDCQW